MKSIVLLLCACTAQIFLIDAAPQLLGGDDHDYYAADWAEFKAKHNKVYLGMEDEVARFEIFKTNMAKAQILQEQEQSTATYGVTQFSDLTEEEFSSYVMDPKFFAKGHNLPYAAIPEDPAPDSYDWRDHGAVTEVKNQGQCGSCWAFSTTGNIEGQWFLKKNQLVSLSEQELVSCDKVDQGCEGGLPSDAYKQIMKLGGLETEKDYPYDGVDEKCKLKSSPAVYINSSVAISKDEGEMAQWLAKNGPISIGINANVMQLYTGGISHPWKIFCNPDKLDHGVLIVGYGTENNTPYWIIKNSWGPSWGEKGYYRAYRGDGVCGLNNMCTSSVVN
ncbi:cathepsin L-like [Watersipora subatra]|uniref:cathepsin L-like n=1 Tax=Watersipora subatra TaxID=2589382 RepID=UPI00355C80B5